MKNKKTELYELLTNAYHGTGGFFDGSYLKKHHRESDEKYAQRKSLAFYLNYLQPCVNAHVTPIFKTQPNREYKGKGELLIKAFLEKVDYTGTKINGFMKRAATGAKTFGVNFLVMDNSVDVKGQSLSQVVDNREFPYAFIVEPIRVIEVRADQLGRISHFAFLEDEEDKGQDNIKSNTRILKVEGWELREGTTGQGRIIAKGEWNIGCVPVVPLFAQELTPGDFFPPSEFTSIAQTNKQIYNACSWLTEILIGQTFSILVFPSNKSEDLTIGTSNALAFPLDATHVPNFISPPAGPADTLANHINSLQAECYRMAVVVNVTGVKSQNSGESKAWDFECTNQILSSFADNIEAAEIKLIELFKKFTGFDFEYSCNYPSDFSISDVASELANAEIAKGLRFGNKFDKEVFKRVLNSYLPELSDEEFDDLVDAYAKLQENEAIDEIYSKPVIAENFNDG